MPDNTLLIHSITPPSLIGVTKNILGAIFVLAFPLIIRALRSGWAIHGLLIAFTLFLVFRILALNTVLKNLRQWRLTAQYKADRNRVDSMTAGFLETGSSQIPDKTRYTELTKKRILFLMTKPIYGAIFVLALPLIIIPLTSGWPLHFFANSFCRILRIPNRHS